MRMCLRKLYKKLIALFLLRHTFLNVAEPGGRSFGLRNRPVTRQAG